MGIAKRGASSVSGGDICAGAGPPSFMGNFPTSPEPELATADGVQRFRLRSDTWRLAGD